MTKFAAQGQGIVAPHASAAAASYHSAPVVVLGAGINGAAIARELALNGCSVWVVDSHDIAFGATSYSSRLIHGGLRYLEYGEFALVRESLVERARLLELAPHLVHPLELMIPVRKRWGGILAAAGRIVGWRWWPAHRTSRDRGLWAVRAGLSLYDLWSDAAQLPRHAVGASASSGIPFARDYRWVCRYYDAQISYPERLAVEMLTDARDRAASLGADFRLFLGARARRDADRAGVVRIEQRTGNANQSLAEVAPAAVINATGAWVDDALIGLAQTDRQFIGGTKGSHLVTFHVQLRRALAGRGIYVEAPDGRPIFILSFGKAVLIGTTDLPFRGDPATATANEEEIAYLLSGVNQTLPEIGLRREDVCFHYCGVRPLPFVESGNAAAITRRHAIHAQAGAPFPLLNIVGGKLTTCRSLAEQTVAQLLPMLGRESDRTSRREPFLGGDGYPTSTEAIETAKRELASVSRASEATVERAWRLWGRRAKVLLAQSQEIESERGRASVESENGNVRQALDRSLSFDPQLGLTDGIVRWTIRHEWARTLGDLIERRLMLLYDESLSITTLRRLALLLADERKQNADFADAEVAATVDRLARHFGRSVDSDATRAPTD